MPSVVAGSVANPASSNATAGSTAASAPASSTSPTEPAPAPPADAAGKDEPPAQTTQITKEAKDSLHKYFTRLGWPRNKKMPKVNTDAALDAIINKFNLKRSQASRQLRNWKAKRYKNAQVNLVLDPEDVEASIYEGLSMEPKEYVSDFLVTLLEGRDVPGCRDATNLCRSIGTHDKPKERMWFIKFLHSNPDHECNKIFLHMLKCWASIAADLFPKCARNMSDQELAFAVRVTELQVSCLDRKWRPQYESISFPSDVRLTEEEYAIFFNFLSDCLFVLWSRSMADDDRRSIEIPTEDLVSRFSLEVLYYVAGWTLQRTSLALLVGESERFKYECFATRHKLTRDEAKTLDLPYQLVELRLKKSLLFPDKAYFDFIRLVESIYIHNLTLDMMLAYVGGDLIQSINDKIRSSEQVRSKFYS